MHVTMANDSAEAILSVSRDNTFDIVLVSLHPPLTDRTSLLAAMRAQASLVNTPILTVGRTSDALDTEKHARLGVADCLTTPIRFPALVGTIEQILKGKAPEPADFRPNYQAHVLVAEDNSVNQRVARLLLEKVGCRVTLVSNGREACVAAAATSYDLVLMDCQMPEMDGYEATREIRARQTGGARLPIVALSAAVLSEERDLCFLAGMDDFLEKPVNILRLRTVLERWLKVPADLRSSTTPSRGTTAFAMP